MRRAALALLLAGCGTEIIDPCSDRTDSACIGLRVESTVPAQVDQLGIRVSGVAHLDARTPGAPGQPRRLPVVTAIHLPDVGGDIVIEVTGYLRGNSVGAGLTSAKVAPRQHQTITVVLIPPAVFPDLAVRDEEAPADLAETPDFAAPPDLALPDTAAPPDLAPRPDLASRPDLAPTADFAPIVDLARPPDLMTAPDLAAPKDLAAPDLSVAPDLAVTADLRPPVDLFVPPDLKPPTRIVFLLPPRSPNFPKLMDADKACTDAANAGGRAGAFRAVLGTNNQLAKDRITLNQGRDIVLWDRVTKVATDATFWSATHLGPINQASDGKTPLACVWTGFKPDGASMGEHCKSWGSMAMMDKGATGITARADQNWAFAAELPCNLSCHVYCIEQ